MHNWGRSLLNTTIYMYSEYVIMPRLTGGGGGGGLFGDDFFYKH